MLKEHGNKAMGTARELAEYMADFLSSESHIDEESNFYDCDFAVANTKAEGELDEIAASSSGWYGIKKIDTGFDSGNLDLFADYYGGGCGVFRSLFDGMSRTTIVEELECMLLHTLNCQEVCHPDTQIILEVHPY